MKMKTKHTRGASWINKNQHLSQGEANQGCSDGLAPWTRVVATPLFGWKPTHRGAPHDQEIKKPQIILVQGELFTDHIKNGSLKRPQPVALLEA